MYAPRPIANITPPMTPKLMTKAVTCERARADINTPRAVNAPPMSSTPA